MQRDLWSNINCDRVLSPGVAVTDNTAQVGQIIDTKGYESLTFVLLSGSLADTDATFTLLVEDGDNSSLTDSASVADEFLLGTEAASTFLFSDDNEVRWIGYNGNKRYVRLTVTPADNSGDVYLAIVAIKGNPNSAPTTMDS